ncbi:unnamed protein product [Thelazia callipaeda]|uniref:RanBD1 domain-containing protein n=1 Tax=Thelazia callipaeda TaxID=103827 RepID=A0A0N5D3Y4_THECL|nr:unnamed protein product [Thelazia callipaeda]
MEELFLSKMTLLNKTFLNFIQKSVSKMPDADLSPTVRDYLKHVEELDRTYGSINSVGKDGVMKAVDVVENSNTNSNSRKMEVSKKDGGSECSTMTKCDVSQKTPLNSALNSFTTTANSPSMPKITFDMSVSPLDASEKRGKKRAKRGGPEEGDNEVIILNHNFLVITFQYSDNFQNSSPLKRDSEEREKEKKEIRTVLHLSSAIDNSPTSSILKSNLNSGNTLNNGTKNGGNSDAVVNITKETISSKRSMAPFVWSEKSAKNESSSTMQNFASEKLTRSVEEGGKTEKAPWFEPYLFTAHKIQNQEDQISGLMQESLSSAWKPDVTPVFSFLKPVSTEKSFEVSNPLQPKFDFKFEAPPMVQSSTTDENEDEYIPPKVENVIVEEPNSLFSLKCSAFVLKGNEYEKLGIGQLYIKKDEKDHEKKILLVRAATTTANVWVNSYIDDTMKFTTIDDAKLRLSCVSNGSPSTYLLRLPNEEDRDKVVAELPQ